MKKIPIILVILTLFLAGMACNFPFKKIDEEIPAVVEPIEGYREEKRSYDDSIVTFLIPNSYYVGDTSELSSLRENLDMGSVDLNNLFTIAQEGIIAWGYDTGSAAEIPTSFVVMKNQEYAAMPLGLISTLATSLLGNNIEIMQETRQSIAGRDTLRWITVTKEAGLELMQVVYVFKYSGVIYLIAFNADSHEVYGQLQNYDLIVASLRIEDLE
jgi:hypothetical protein